MAFDLPLSRKLAKAGWKVKIRDKERLEEPHLTIVRGTMTWRVGLRSHEFLDDGKWKDFPKHLQAEIESKWDVLCAAWDRMYPHNPVPSDQENGDDDG